MGKRVEADKKLFYNTIQEVRKLVGKHRGEYSKDVMGLNKHNTKVPFTHLQGRRNKLHKQHALEKERAREEVIQYDSSMRLLNSSVM
jgi:predicted nuclease of restriction endonuclease-like RecB superfamily